MTKKRRIEWFEDHFGKFPNYEKMLKWLDENGFFDASASTKYHGNYPGGLFDHSVNVVEVLLDLTDREQLVWERAESPLIIGFFHDICKIDCYEQELLELPDKPTYTYNSNTLYKGHGDKSLMLLSHILLLTEEEAACIRYHMGAFTDKSEWSDFTGAIHRFPNVLFAHTADMIAAHIIEKED